MYVCIFLQNQPFFICSSINFKGLHHYYQVQWRKLPDLPNLALSKTIFGGFDIFTPPYNAMASLAEIYR